jgi:uncharacterized membrane protein
MVAVSKNNLLRIVVALLFIFAGLNHFIMPRVYLSMVPDYLPVPAALVQISGMAEIAGGLGVMFAATRKIAAWGLILLLVAVLPANVEMALRGWREIPSLLLWLRLPLQFVFIWGVYRLYLSPAKSDFIDRTEKDDPARSQAR